MSLGHFMSHNFVQEECFDFVDILSQSPWVDKIARSTEAWGDIYELKYMSITYMPWSIQQSLKIIYLRTLDERLRWITHSEDLSLNNHSDEEKYNSILFIKS